MPISVILVSSGIFHPNLLARATLRRILSGAERFSLRKVASLEQAVELDWADYAALVLYVHHKRISDEALAWLDGYLRGGGGLLALHSASASFKALQRYQAMLGGRFRAHGRVSRFRVRPGEGAARQFGVDAPFEVFDERYLHEMIEVDSVDFVSEGPEGAEPFVWTRRHGAGRVCYCAAGHTAASLRHPQVQRILVNGLIWAAGNGSEGR